MPDATATTGRFYVPGDRRRYLGDVDGVVI
jgi:hypothetical protein